MFLLEVREENIPLDTVESCLVPVQHFFKARRTRVSMVSPTTTNSVFIIGTCSDQAASCQLKRSLAFVVFRFLQSTPSRESTVKQRLHERGAEEVFTIFPREL